MPNVLQMLIGTTADFSMLQHRAELLWRNPDQNFAASLPVNHKQQNTVNNTKPVQDPTSNSRFWGIH